MPKKKTTKKLAPSPKIEDAPQASIGKAEQVRSTDGYWISIE